jgi:hypothetical protein
VIYLFCLEEYNVDETDICICIWEFSTYDFPSIDLDRGNNWGYSITPIIEKNQLVNFMLMRTKLDADVPPPYSHRQALTLKEIISISEEELCINFPEEIVNKFASILTIYSMNSFKKRIIERK